MRAAKPLQCLCPEARDIIRSLTSVKLPSCSLQTLKALRLLIPDVCSSCGMYSSRAHGLLPLPSSLTNSIGKPKEWRSPRLTGRLLTYLLNNRVSPFAIFPGASPGRSTAGTSLFCVTFAFIKTIPWSSAYTARPSVYHISSARPLWPGCFFLNS